MDTDIRHKSISAEFPFTPKFINVNDSKLHYIDEGVGDPILFLHGIPASNYVWRNVIPHLRSLGRCIAPDLIGFGKSDKPDIEYTIDDHLLYLEKFIQELNLKNIILVLHGWGSIMGFELAMKNEALFKGIVFYESYIRPKNDDELSLPSKEQMYLLEEEDQPYDILMNASEFVDKILPQSMLRHLSEEEAKHYREPFGVKGSGKPLLQYIKEIPCEGNSTNQRIAAYSKKLTKSKLPKLMLYSLPGFITTITDIIWAKQNLSQLEVNEIGEALHYSQESNPALMGETISIWLQGLEQQHTR